MKIESLNLDQVYHLIEGMFCYGTSGEESEDQIRSLLSDLIEYHESNEKELFTGLDYYENGIGQRPILEYDWENRQRYFEDHLGYK